MEVTYNNHYTLIANFFHTAFIESLPLIPISGGQFYCGSDYMTERSGLHANLFIYTVSGRGMIQYRGEEIALLPGSAIVFNCDEYQYYATGENCNWNFLWVHFRGMGFPTFDKLINEDALSISYPSYDTVKHMFDQLDAVSQEPCMNSDIVSSQILYQLLCELLLSKNKKNGTLYQTPKESIVSAATYIRNHYAEDISIEQLSELHHISKYYFIRLFKMQYNQTPHEYLINIRVMQSKKILTTTQMSVEAIALAVGFKDGNTFIKVFKKKVGETPARFRKSFVF